MATTTTTSALTGFFKERYGKLQDLIPPIAQLAKEIPFEEAEKTGNKYHVPVVVQEENGFTYALAGAGAFALNGSESMATQDAQVDGSQILGQATMDYETAAKAKSDAQAFGNSTKVQVKNLWESGWRRLEIDGWYGRSGLGVVDVRTNVNTTTTTLTFTLASWSPGIWAGRKGAKVQFFAADDNAIASSGADAIFAVKSVDVSNRKVTFTGTTGGISALDTAVNSKAHNVYFYSATSGTAGTFAHNSMVGMDTQISAVTGTYFNIDRAAYDLVQGASFSVGSTALTFSKALLGHEQAVSRGLMEDATLWCSTLTWVNMATDQAGLRRYGGERRAKQGFEALEFIANGGTLTIRPHTVIKQGEAFLFPMKSVKRIGAQDISFKRPGKSGDEDIFLELGSNAGFEYRVYSHQAFFLETPAKAVKYTAIVNATS